jgi:hypothetical protein
MARAVEHRVDPDMFALPAFDVAAVDYLLTPIAPERLIIWILVLVSVRARVLSLFHLP